LELMTTGDVMKVLGITRMTLYNWMKAVPPKIHAARLGEGKRVFFAFEKSEVMRLKKLMKPTREKGKSLLKAKGGKR